MLHRQSDKHKDGSVWEGSNMIIPAEEAQEYMECMTAVDKNKASKPTHGETKLQGTFWKKYWPSKYNEQIGST